MKPFNVLGKFSICVLGILGVCLSFPESAVAKVRIVTVSVTTTHTGGIGEISPTTIVHNLTCDGYVYITSDTKGNTLVYNNDDDFSSDPKDLIDLSSDEIKNLNNAIIGKVDPDYFPWSSYRLIIEAADTSKPIYVKMDGGSIGEIVLGGDNNIITKIDFAFTGGSVNRFICAGTVTGTCKISMSGCTIRGSEGLVYDSNKTLNMWNNAWSKLTLTHGDGITYGYPHEMINSIKFLKDKGATINNSFRPTNNVYEIHDATDFYWFEDYVNTGSSNIIGKLMSDIEIVSNTMIGTNEHPFQGEFYGNGHRISGLDLSVNLSQMTWNTYNNIAYAGLFGYVKGTSSRTAKVKNLTVEGSIDCSSSSNTDFFVAGGVVGIADQYVDISNVVSNVNITNRKDIKAHIGGIAGTTEIGTLNGPLYIDSCVFKGTIDQYGYDCCGGIVGYIRMGHIYDCLNTGTVTDKENSSSNHSVCGILGYVNDAETGGFTMKRCLNVGTVSGSKSYAIGIAKNCAASAFESLYYKEGSATSATNNSTVFGNSLHSVTDEQLKSGEVTYALNGGLTSNPTWRQTIGTDDYPTLDASHKVVYHTYADCKSKVQYSNEDNGRTSEGHNYEDGICSYCKAVQSTYMTAKNGYYEISTDKQLIWFAAYVNAGNTSANAKLMADITLSDTWTPINSFAGTFDGQGHTVKSVSVTASDCSGFFCINSGTISNLIIGSGTISGVGYVGGICGLNTGTISNCANYASIVKFYYAITTYRTYPAGGICGLNNGSNAKVANCFNAGSITVTNMGLGTVSGAVVSSLGSAESGAQFVNCYYLGGTASAGILGSTSTSTVFVSSKDDFSNGSVTYRLNNETTTNPVWRQNIGQDSYPVLDKSHQVVYYTYADCDVKTRSYSNTNNGHTSQGHKYVGGICSYCRDVKSNYMTANSNGYYEIGDATQLKWFAAYVNAGNGSVKARLTNNVAQVGNIMIGTHEHPFQGEFDGNRFQISGLNQVSDFGKYNETTEYAGLFGFVQGESDANAVIKNLTVKGAIKLASSTESGTTYFVAGGVVGIADQYVEIEDVVSYVDITIERNIKTHVGGIAATTQYSSANGPLYLDKCVYHGTIKQSGSNACGGIVGYINRGHIHDCVNAGTITNVGGVNNSWVCGILGYVNNSSADNFSVKRCLNVGTVSGSCSYAIGYAKACPSSDFELLYYKSDTIAATNGTADFGESIHEVSADQLKSGSVAYALNEGLDSIIWYQTIGTDDYPVFDSSHGVVYNTYADCESTVQYSNVNNGRTHQGHLWDEGSVTTQPKCTETGVKTFVCQFQCSTSKTEPVAANGHTELVLAAVAPTCTETGLTEGKKCSVCDSTLIAQTEVAAKGHTEKDLAAVEPTCTENGFSAGKKCSVCNKILEEQTIIPPTGHTLGSVKSDAIDHWFICKTCESMYGEEDHNHNAEDHSCSVCGVDKAEQDESGYYLVGNRKQLYWLNDYINYNHSANVRLTDDIVVNVGLLNAAGGLNESDTDLLVWNPISEYKGAFDGQGHSISGLYYKNEYNDNVGLFDIAYSSAVIRNLVIRDSYFEGITVGAICGEAWHSTIENCASHNTIKGQIIGGLVGRGVPQMKNSISTCQLVASDSIVVEDLEPAVGLLVGSIQPEGGMSWNYNANMDAKIKNCFYATSSDLNPFGKSVPYTGDGSENSVLDTLRVGKKALSAFQSGEVAYLLNETYDEESKAWVCNETTPVWRQNLLGHYADAFPVLDPSHKRVVKVAEGKTYSYTVKDGKQFGTFCYDVDVALPESMSAFHMVYVDKNKIFGMIVEDGFVPAGTPVILRKPSTKNNVTISFSAAYANATRQLGDTCVSGQLVGLLKVEDGQKLPMGDSLNFTYTMQTIDGVQNFYVINSGNFKATQYRCYLDTRVGQNTFQMQAAMNRGECLFDCEETGFQELMAEDQTPAPAYNLQGQRVQRMGRGGIYVQGDKRKMIK